VSGPPPPLPMPTQHAAAPPRAVGVRWTVLALLFAATTLCYLDRTVLAVLGPTLTEALHWSEGDYSHVVMAFQLAYAIGLAAAGRFLDVIGVRLGYALAVGAWSLAAMAHALVGSVSGFMTARFLLGLAEAGNFPAAIKSVAQWFPIRERALATGIFNSGANIGALVAPLLVALLVTRWGWQGAFCATGAIGLLWPLAWWRWYRSPQDHPRLGAYERALLAPTAVDAAGVPAPAGRAIRQVLGQPASWAFVIAKLMTDPVWWFYLYWFPKFLHTQGVELQGLPLPMAIVYLVSDAGSILGGWLSSHLMARGWTSTSARQLAMLCCVLCILPVVFAPALHSLWWSVALVALAAAGHQGWSANLFTLVSDHLPQSAVGTVVGIGGTAGALGGVLMAFVVGWVLQYAGYQPLFIIGAAVYVVSLLVIRTLLKRHTASG